MTVQLPSVVVDDVVEDSIAAGVLIINRIPEPGEREVPLDTTITFEIHHIAGPVLPQGDLSVVVNGVAVITAGVIGGDWSASYSSPDTSTLRVVLMAPAAFSSDGEVEVAVRALSVGLDTTYNFHVVDETRPRTVRAVSRSKRSIRVTFSEPMEQCSPTCATDALNPACFSIDRVSVPAVELNVVAVESVSASEVDLITDVIQTFGAAYELTVTGLRDVAGNLHVVAPDNVVSFIGFTPPYPVGRRFLITDFIPTLNLGEDNTGDLRMFLAIIQEVVNVVLSDIDEWAQILDCDVAAEEFVDAMLADLGNPFEFGLSLIDKRRLIRVLVPLYKLRGTRPGLIAAVQFFLGIPITVETYTGTGWELTEEGEEGGDELSEVVLGTPPASLGPDQHGLYSFRIVSAIDLTPEQRDQVTILANYMKCAHEHYLGTYEPSVPDPTLSDDVDPFDPLVPLDHLVLDLSTLGDDSVPGNWTLH